MALSYSGRAELWRYTVTPGVKEAPLPQLTLNESLCFFLIV